MNRIALLLSLCLPLLGWGQATLEISQAPRYFTPWLDSLYFASNFNSWDPGNPAFQMVDSGNGTWTFTLTANPGDLIEYKYTRGDWARVENQANGSFLPNRSFTYADGLVIRDTVESWDDLSGNHTVVGNTYVLDVNFPMQSLGRQRGIWVYLPPDYYTSTQSYPVLYMHDGQNLFDVAFTAFGTEWAIDEALDSIQNAGGVKAIVVGVDNGTVNRIDEYTPWTHPTYGGGDGEAYLDFLVNELKPYVDANFRTLPGRTTTGVMGSSLGGLISLYAALERPDVFGKAGVFSPSFWFSDSCYVHARTQGHSQAMRICMVAGDQESQSMVPDMYRMEDTLQAHGFGPGELNVYNRADGQHSEWFWAREFPGAYTWLFQDLLTDLEEEVKTLPAWQLRPLGRGKRFRVEGPGKQPVRLWVVDLQGRTLYQEDVVAGQEVNLARLQAGLYVAVLEAAQDSGRQKIHLFNP